MAEPVRRPEAPRRTQAERTAASARRMIRAATRLIARQGYTKTTLAQVGREAGYTGGLVSHRFGSKLNLLRELVAQITGRFYTDQIQSALRGRSGLDAICAAAEVYLDELVVREERMRALYVLMGEALGPVPEMKEVFAALNRGFRESAREWIERGMATGEIRADLDADAEAALFVGTLRGVALQWMADPGCLDLDAVRRSLTGVLRERLAARAAEGTG